jgi:protocatechuate 3,4-dioxygenase beta subunit
MVDNFRTLTDKPAVMITMRHLLYLVLIISSCSLAPGKNKEDKKSDFTQSNEPPECDCCVFDEVKNKKLSHITQLAPDSVPGERIQISGIVYKVDGKTPASNLSMYFYHTNSMGKYAKHGTEVKSSHAWWHGYCRGWLKTNEKGEYQINTIKPAPYPGGNEPAHIHPSVLNDDKSCTHLADFVFKGDPFLNKTYWDNTRSFWKRIGKKGDPEYDGIDLRKNANGMLEGKRNIVLNQ